MAHNDPIATSGAEATQQPARRRFFGTVSDLVLAGIGVVDVLADGPHTLYRRSIERGANRAHRLWDRVPRGRRLRGIRGRVTGRGRRASKTVEQIDAALARLNVPTPADFDALTAQVTELEARINQLG